MQKPKQNPTKKNLRNNFLRIIQILNNHHKLELQPSIKSISTLGWLHIQSNELGYAQVKLIEFELG